MLKDEVNKSVDLFFIFIGGFFTALLAMIGYLFVNIDDLTNLKVGILIVGIVGIVFALVCLIFFTIKKIKELRYLE